MTCHVVTGASPSWAAGPQARGRGDDQHRCGQDSACPVYRQPAPTHYAAHEQVVQAPLGLLLPLAPTRQPRKAANGSARNTAI